MKNTAEEKRIREIDEIACLFDPETVEAAKYGPEACTAQEMTYRAAVKAVQSGIDRKTAEAKAMANTLLHGQVQNGTDPKMAEARATVKDLLRG